jgi:Nif-specific regulatory protein
MKYITDRELGRGGFGTVYEAHDPAGNRFAVKVVKRSDRMRTELLKKEFDFLSTLDHKRIVKAVDFDLEGPLGPMMVTEMVDGIDLRAYVESRGLEHLPLAVAKVMDGLRYLHGLGRVHGDIKPDSILVYEENGLPEVKLIDAGLDIEEGSRLPTLAGTPSYMAPEIIRNLRADGLSDLYSLGVTLYEVMTGESPFMGEDQKEVFRKHLEYRPPPPSKVKADLDPAWDGFIGKLMEKEPLLRYKNADQAGLEIERISGCPGIYVEHLMPPRPNPMAVRTREIEQAEAYLMPSGGKGVLLYGERGCGISRILERVGNLAKLRGHRVFTVVLDEAMPAIAQVVEEALGPQADSIEAQASPAVGASADGSACFAEVLESFRSRLPADREHLLVVDGGEAMERHELALLGALAAEMKGRIGVVVGYRIPTAASSPPGPDAYVQIGVGPLDAEEVERAISLHFGTYVLPSELAEAVHNATGGNAGLLELTLDHLWLSRSVSYTYGKGCLQLAWDGRVEAPASADGVAREKIAALSPSSVELLKVILVGGGRIETDLLSRLLEPGTLHSALLETAGVGLIERTDGWTRLVIGSQSLREILSPAIRPDEVERVSLQMADALESRARGASDYYRLGLLYLQGGRHQEAFRHLTGAGGLFKRFSIRDALLAYRKALECRVEPDLLALVSESIGDLKLEQGDLEAAQKRFGEAASFSRSSLRKLGWVTGLRGEFAESVRLLTQCEQSAMEGRDEIEAARARSDLGYVYALQSERDLSLEVLERAREVFKARGMDLEVGQASNRIAFTQWKASDFQRAAQAWTDAKRHFDRAGDRKRAAVCLMSLGLCRMKEMNFASAEECFRQALGVFTDIRAMGEKASCQQNYALLLLNQGRLKRATDFTEQALAVNSLLGRHSAIMNSRILLAALRLEAGNWQEAEGMLLGVLEHRPPPDVFQKSMAKRYLALANAVAGKFELASGFVDESYELAGNAGDAEGQGQAMLARSMIMLRKGDCGGATDAAGEALSALRLSSSVLLANEAQRVVGEALCLMGEQQAGIPALLMAKDGFEIAPCSLSMARVLRALALGYLADGDLGSAGTHLRKSMEIFRAAGARYDHALALLSGGTNSVKTGSLVRARQYLEEAARIFEALKIEDLYREAVNEMEKIPSGDLEIGAVSSLSKISRTLNSSHDLTTVLNLAMELAIEYLGAERGVLMLKDEATGDLTTFAQRDMDSESIEEVISISRSIVESVRKTKEPVIASDATRDPRFKHSSSIKTHNIMSVMCVPLRMGEDLLGIIYLDSRDVSSGFSGLETAFVEAFANQVSLAIVNARLVGRLYDDMADLRMQAAEKYSFENIIGPGKRMQEVLRKVDKAAGSKLRILITGENGTGKQVIANLVHQLSGRKDKPMIQVNCAAISKDLLEAELFGIEKYVATGVSARSGYFERADGGTIFLDEIGDMPDTTQMKVLRVLAGDEFERVGGSKTIKVDVRVISATNKDLKELVEKGLFRKDLYYRLNQMPIRVPSLRERMEDLPYLVDHFLARCSAANSKPDLKISREASTLLRQYWWPGNVRELETCIEHAVVKADGDEIKPEHLHDDILENLRSRDPSIQLGTDHQSLPDAVRQLEKQMIERALKESGGVKTAAAERLGIHESTLRKKIRLLGIR